MDLAPHVLKKISLTINTPCSSTTQSLSLSTSKHHPPSVVNAIPSCRFIWVTRVPYHHLLRLPCTFTYDALTLTLTCEPHVFCSLPIDISHPPSVVDAVPLLHSAFTCLCSHMTDVRILHQWLPCVMHSHSHSFTLIFAHRQSHQDLRCSLRCVHMHTSDICILRLHHQFHSFTHPHSHAHIWRSHWGSCTSNTGSHTQTDTSHSRSMLHQVFLASMSKIGGLDGCFIGAGWCSWCARILSHFISGLLLSFMTYCGSCHATSGPF